VAEIIMTKFILCYDDVLFVVLVCINQFMALLVKLSSSAYIAA